MLNTASFRKHQNPWTPVKFLILIIVSLGIAGCVSHAKTLREAQDNFNGAASLENQIKIDPLATDSIAATSQALAGYKLTLETVTKLIDEKEKALKADNLLGSAYTLKALSQWRLGNYEAAVATVNKVKSAQDITLFPRDKAIIDALRGLIKNDQAYTMMNAKDPNNSPVHSFAEIKTLLMESVDDLNAGNAAVQEGHNIRLYLSVSKLAALKNWLDLFGKPGRYSKDDPSSIDKTAEQNEWCIKAKPGWEIFTSEVQRLGKQEPGASVNEASVKWWGVRLGMPESCQ